MSRRGNCYDKAVAVSSFQLLKRERIRRKFYMSRDDSGTDAPLSQDICWTIEHLFQLLLEAD